MPKDNRYIAVKSLIETGRIKKFSEIFEHIPKKVVYTDLGVNYSKFKRMIASPDLFTLRELAKLARLIEIEARAMFKMAFSQTEVKKGTEPDIRYISIKSLLETNRIQNFRAIFEHIPKMVVYTDLGVNYTRFNRTLASPDLFTLRELTMLGNLLETDPIVIIEIAYSQHELDKKQKVKRKK